MRYGGSRELDPPTPEDERNILTALRQTGRVVSISLTISRSLLEKLYTIQDKPLSELEDLVLLSQDGVTMTLPGAFRWGSRLRRLHSIGIVFPSLLQLLSSSRNLVDLHLHKVLNPSLISPKVLTILLAGMTQLRSLSLHFFSAYHYPTPPRKRVVLPVLAHLDFRGNAEYLASLVTGIDAPRLGHIEVAFSNVETWDLSKISEFIGRIGIHRSHRRADILSSDDAISISFTQTRAPTCFKLQLLYETIDLQLYYISRVCVYFSAFLHDVEDLCIRVGRRSRRKDSLDGEQWLEPINLLTGVKWIHVAGNFSTQIVRALQQPETAALSALQGLYIPQPGPRHTPLREAVVSFMTSRRLSGHLIAVEYEQLTHTSEIGTTYAQFLQPLLADSSSSDEGQFPHHVTIETLCDDNLLNIFRQYLGATPHLWPTLVRVCQRWRQILFTSPLGLNIRLYCTHGTPVLKFLDCWPALPIILQYGGLPSLSPPAAEDDDNIVAAMKQSSRVSSISLTVTSSLIEKLCAISEPFLELEELALLSRDEIQLTLPSTFRWGDRLRTLHSTRVAILSFPHLLSPCHGLVDLQLHEIPSAGYFSPEAFADTLSEMTQLRSLLLHLLSFPRRRSFVRLPPQPGERVLLPALTHLKYRGTSKYLDCFVAIIDAPRLENIDITFFSQPTMDASQLGRFIERIEMQMSLSQAEVKTSTHAISLSFTDSSTSTPLRLHISCKQLDWQLSCMAQVCDQFSPFLFGAKNLGINATQTSIESDDMDGGQWLNLVRSFRGAKDLLVAGELATDILRALRSAGGGHTSVLPALRNLRVRTPELIDGPFRDAALSFFTSRRLSGRPIELEFLCHICNTSFTRQQELKAHLVDMHAYQIVCSYCGGDFELEPGNDHLCRDHLESKHPEIARNDEVFSNPFATLEGLINRHSSLRAPGAIAVTTTGTTPHSSIVSDASETASDTSEITYHTFESPSEPSDDDSDVLDFF
jgi:hypothetical protein